MKNIIIRLDKDTFKRVLNELKYGYNWNKPYDDGDGIVYYTGP